MQAVFADTFYWIALTNTDDLIHQEALSLSRSLRTDRVITTEEVLDEYLAYFSGARRSVREHAGNMVARSLTIAKSRSFRKATNPSWRASRCTALGPTRAIA